MKTSRIILLQILAFFGMGNVLADSSPQMDKEIRCLALNIYFEARSESQRGQFAVAAVTMNRVISDKYPNTVCEVVWQRHQFSWTHDGKSDRPKEKKAWESAKALAKLVHSKYLNFHGEKGNAWDITLGALHYYASYIPEPYWAKNKNKSKSIGTHTFVSM
ncbi:MAG TPA: cell wall hydrolase [Gammaproteobacteria bacterium]|nr:cell wall hydrolase [Gammaproteobacteria bacterium]